MRVYIAAYALLLGLLAYLGLSVAGVVPQVAEREGNAPLAVVLVFTAIFDLLYAAVIVAAARGGIGYIASLAGWSRDGRALPSSPGLCSHVAAKRPG